MEIKRHKTKAGSTVEISGKHGGIYRVAFDWVEEKNACIDCSPSYNSKDHTLDWSCECGRCGGSEELFSVTDNTEGKEIAIDR
jgi:hypothetical protein